VFVEGKVNPETGFVMDFADISAAFKDFIDLYLDHRHLNDIVEYPSSELLLYWLGQAREDFPWSKLALEETCTSYAELTREEFNATHP
jgi:6-pyruvoyltetrahydropterin/6-carboxytetrahydropterin synthase